MGVYHDDVFFWILKHTWNSAIFYATIFAPFRIAFLYEYNYQSITIIDQIVDVVFILDIIENFFLGYRDDSETLVMEHKVFFCLETF